MRLRPRLPNNSRSYRYVAAVTMGIITLSGAVGYVGLAHDVQAFIDNNLWSSVSEQPPPDEEHCVFWAFTIDLETGGSYCQCITRNSKQDLAMPVKIDE